MTDRELLELAAKAYADPNVNFDGFSLVRFIGRDETLGCNVMAQWNPLYDDGDALRLAVKLQMQLYVGTHKVIAEICSDSEFPPILQKVFVESDPYAATRRAVVRAAAEIGKEM